MAGVSIAALAVIIAALVSHHIIALWTILAYPAYMLLAWCAYSIARLRGWNRLWKRDIKVAPTAAGPQINVWLAHAHPETLLIGGYEIDPWMMDPDGTETKGSMNTYKFRAYASYPGAFPGAAQVVPGIYSVIWREQKPAGTGKWRIIDAARVTVTADDMQYPPAIVGAGTDATSGQIGTARDPQ